MNNNDNFSIPFNSPFNVYKKLNSKEKYPSILSDRSLKNKIQENLFYSSKSNENNSISNSSRKQNNINNNNSNDSSKTLKFNSSNNIHVLKNENKSRNNQNSLFKSVEQKDLSSSYFQSIGNTLITSSNSLSKDSNSNNIYFTKEINMNFNNNINNDNNNDYFAQSNNNSNKNSFFKKKGGIFLNNRYNSNNEIPSLKYENKENSNKLSFTPIIVKDKKRINTNIINYNYNDDEYYNKNDEIFITDSIYEEDYLFDY